MEYIQQDRRKSDMPVEMDRRIAERISLLEYRVDSHGAQLDDNKQLLEKFLDKFEHHISDESDASRSMQTTMVKVTTVVDSLTTEIKRTNDTLTTFNEKLDVTHTKVTEWDSAARAIIKVALVLATLISAGWTVFEFYETHPTTQTSK